MDTTLIALIRAYVDAKDKLQGSPAGIIGDRTAALVGARKALYEVLVLDGSDPVIVYKGWSYRAYRGWDGIIVCARVIDAN